jgi:hypothetical protein
MKLRIGAKESTYVALEANNRDPIRALAPSHETRNTEL